MQFTLSHHGLRAAVDSHGGELVSLRDAAGTEYIWNGDPAFWPGRNPLLFPIVGNLKDGRVLFHGQPYEMSRHGFARDLEHTLLRAEGDTIQLELRADDAIKAERFPYDFVLTSTFRLEGKTVHHTLQVTNPGTEELRFGIGFHPAFNVPFDDKHTTTDYEFRFDQPESPVILDARPNGLLSGKSYCMAGRRTGTIGICEKDTGRNVTCKVEGYPDSLIWSAPAKPVRFVCIEPWHSLPAAVTDPQDWEQRAAAACLAPGESWQTTLSTTFDR